MHGPGAEWAAEFSQTQAANSRGAGKAAGTSAEALEQTHALRDTLASSQDPKFRKSKFLQFVSKMSRGEIILEDNQATPPPPRVWMVAVGKPALMCVPLTFAIILAFLFCSEMLPRGNDYPLKVSALLRHMLKVHMEDWCRQCTCELGKR